MAAGLLDSIAAQNAVNPATLFYHQMKKPTLPRFNPRIVPTSPPAMLAQYQRTRDAARQRRLRNQRIGDFALGCLFVLIGYVVALLMGRI
jgi:hypothetical protein